MSASESRLVWGLRPLFVVLAISLSLSTVGVLRGDNQLVGGCQWEIVPSASPGFDSLQSVTALSSNDVWAVGGSQRYPTPIQPLIEHWDGATWSVVDSPSLPGPAGLFEVDGVTPSDVWAIGQFNPNSQLGTLIEHWDGSEWAIVLSPHPGTVNGFPEAELTDIDTLSPDNVWAVGTSVRRSPFRTEAFVLHWDGTAWSLVPTPQLQRGNGLSSVLAVAPNDVWASGFVTDPIYGNRQPLVEHWDGNDWTVFPTPTLPPEFSTIGKLSGASPRDIWASGLYRTPAGGYQPYFEHWDGEAWTLVPIAPKGFSAVLTPVSIGPNNVWAVGGSNNFVSGPSATLIERWDGEAWKAVSSPNSTATASILWDATAVSTNDIWAVGGDFTQGSPLSTAHTLVQHCTSTGGLRRHH